MNFTLSSRALTAGTELPARFTRQGENVSPPLEWTQPPAGTRSLAVLCDEPNSPTGNVNHWLVYNLPHTTTGLPENLPALDPLANDARQGTNDFNRTGYSGPSAPTVGSRRLLFQVFALNAALPGRPGMTKSALVRMMESRVIARARLTVSVAAERPVPTLGFTSSDNAQAV